MRRVLALPLSTVERAGSGDLVSRTTADIDALARTIRFAVPETLIAAVTAVLDGRRGRARQPDRGAAVRRRPARDLGRDAVVPAARAGRLPLGARGLRDDDRHGRRDRRRRPHGRRARPARASGSRRVDADLADAYRAERRTLLPAHDLVPLGRRRLRPAGRCSARVGRLARLERPRLDRRGDGGRALRAGARRPGRPADLLAGRDPGRRQLVRAAGRDLEGAGRPHRDRRGAGRRAAARRRRALRVRRRAGRAARDRPRARARRAGRGRRAVRRGQVDARPAAGRHPPAAASVASTWAVSGSSTSSSTRFGARSRS